MRRGDEFVVGEPDVNAFRLEHQLANRTDTERAGEQAASGRRRKHQHGNAPPDWPLDTGSNDSPGNGRKHVFEPAMCVADVRESALHFFLETVLDQRDNALGDRRGKHRPVRLSSDDGGEAVGDGVAVERLAAGEHFVEHAAECPDVSARVHGEPASLLGTHRVTVPRIMPSWVASIVTRCDISRIVSPLTAFASPKSSTLTLPGRRLDVRRLRIPMDDALCMRGREGVGGLACNRQRFIQRQRPLMEAIGQRGALDQLEDECDDVLTLLESVNGGDVGMIQGRQDLRLAREAAIRAPS